MQITNLRAYLYEIGMTSTDFAKLMECTRQHIDNIAKGRSYPSFRLSRDIFKATDGVINIPPKPFKTKKEKAPVEEIAKI